MQTSTILTAAWEIVRRNFKRQAGHTLAAAILCAWIVIAALPPSLTANGDKSSAIIQPSNKLLSVSPGVALNSTLATTTNFFGNNIWTSSGPNNDIIVSVVVDPHNSNTLYAGSHGAFKSINGGGSWRKLDGLGNFFVEAIAVDPFNSTTLYAATFPYHMYKSTDGGGSWKFLPAYIVPSAPSAPSAPSGSSGHRLVIDPRDSQKIYDVNQVGVFKSSNGGARWRQIYFAHTSGLDQLTLSINPVDTRNLYLGTYRSGLLKSIDGGESWVTINHPDFNRSGVSALIIDPINSSTIYVASLFKIYKSTNGGEVWKFISFVDDQVVDFGINSSFLNTIYAITQQSVLKSIDGGESWSQINNGLPKSASFFSIFALTASSAGQLIHIGTNTGVFSYSDDGSSGSVVINSIFPAIPICSNSDQGMSVRGIGFQAGVVAELTAPGGKQYQLSGTQVFSYPSTSFNMLATLAGTGTWKLRAKNPNGSQSNLFSFQAQPGPTPAVSLINPTNPTASSNDQQITVNGTNFKYGLTVTTISSTGVIKTLSGPLIQNGTTTSFSLLVTLGLPGNWRVRVNNPDCGQSGFFSFLVNCAPSCSVVVSNTITIPPISAPVIIAGTNAIFSAVIAPNGCTGSPAYDWDFGDGTPHSSQQNPIHIYTRLGSHTWKLTVDIPGATSCVSTGVLTTPFNITSISPTNPTSSSSEQAIMVSGIGFHKDVTVRLSRPDGGVITINSNQIQNVTPTSFAMRVTLDQPGEWHIQVRDIYGNRTFNAPIQINSSCAPVIIKLPYVFPSNLGMAIQVEFKGSGTTPFKFQWYLGIGKDLDHPVPDESHPIPKANDSQYLPAQTLSPTSYWVRITNNCGSVDSQSVMVKGSLPIQLIDPACESKTNCSGNLTAVQLRGKNVGIVSDVNRLVAANVVRSVVVADGVTFLLLRVESEMDVTFSLDTLYKDWGVLMPLDGSSETLSLKSSPQRASDNRKYAFALYRAPMDFPEVDPFISLTASSITHEGRTKIQLFRPPVVLAHGVWSSGEAWRGLDRYLTNRGFRAFRLDYGSVEPAGSFDPKEDNYPVITLVSATRRALNTLRSEDVAVTQVDVVGHSMGGLVARSRVASLQRPYFRKDNFYKGDFHKIITAGTPHLGSLMVDFLLIHRCDGVYRRKNGSEVVTLEDAFLSFNSPIGSALYGFQTASTIIKSLGMTEVPSHAIYGVEPRILGGGTEKTLNTLVKPLSGYKSDVDTILGGEGAHDTIVPIQSQQGGLQSTATSRISEVVHADKNVYGTFSSVCDTCTDDVNETASEDVWLRVLTLLKSAIGSDKFDYFPQFKPIGTEIKPAICQIASGAQQASSKSVANLRAQSAFGSQLSISLSPNEGTIVHTGDIVPLTLTIQHGNATKGAIFNIGGSFFNVDGAGPYTASFRITSTKAEKIEIAAFTYGDGPDNYLASTFVLLQSKTSLVSIAASPNSIQLDKVGDIEPISVTGEFADGSKMDLTSSDAATSYSTQSGTKSVVSVSSLGIVEARGAGQETIVITNASKKITVPVTVITGNPAPVIVGLSPSSILAKGKAFTLNVNGSNFFDGSVVYWNGSPRLTTFASPTKLTAEILDTDISTPGMANVIVFNPLPGGGTALGQVTVADCVPLGVITQPVSKAVSAGSVASFTAAASGNPTPTIQWQVAANGSNTFSDIPGATSATLNFTANAADNGKKYRAVFTNACGTATSNAATLTLVATPLLVSELRFSGPGGSGDWFIELYNNTDASLSIAGRQLGIINTAGDTSFAVNLPANGVIPARGNYLIAGPNYSLLGLAVPDLQVTALPFTGIGGVGVFNGSINNSANRIDSVSYNSVPANASFAYFREGTALASLGGTTAEHSWVRKLADGLPQDTNNNQADFVLLSLTGGAINGVAATLGVPGPQSSTSPMQSNDKVPSLMLDPNISSASPPNRERNTTPVPNGAQGTLTLRRKFTNNTGAPIKKLRFRIVDITNSQTGSEAELRALSSVDVMIKGQLVRGVTLEQPPAQPNGGGLNSTLAVGSVTLANPLPAGASINVQFLLGVQRSGGFRFFVNVEALP